MYGESDGYRPSGLMKNALVAHRVFQDQDEEALTDVSVADEDDWTYLLGEQMGIQVGYGDVIQSVLLFLLRELENSLNPWPPPQNQEDWMPVAEAALGGMTPPQLYAALLAGPGRWRRGSLEARTVDSLASKLRYLLVRSLAKELAAVSTRWVQWNIRDLRKRRGDLIAKQQAEAAEALRLARGPKAVAVVTKGGKRIPPPPQEMLDHSKDRGGFFQPPGRT